MAASRGNTTLYLQENLGVQEGTPLQVGCISRAGGKTWIKQHRHYLFFFIGKSCHSDI